MKAESSRQWSLLLAVFIIATCGLIYELVAGTLASYLLGDSVTQFSLIIGIYLFSMGIGAFISRYINKDLLTWFVRIEILTGAIGGFSAALLFLLFPVAAGFKLALYALVSATGILVGTEIPLLMRILEDQLSLKEIVSRVFTFDYIGALLASIIFPLLLVPHLGLIRTSVFFGMFNVAIGWYLIHKFRHEITHPRTHQLTAILVLLAQTFVFAFAGRIMDFSESLQYNENVIYARSSSYQRIVLTHGQRDLRLFLNGNLQFSSLDEYRYHEALVHPAASSVTNLKQVLVLGGGDGLAVRELLRYLSIDSITLVDLDPAMVKLFSSQDILTHLNNSSLKNPRVKVFNQDAFIWLRNNRKRFDLIIVDFPDPSNYSIGKLYSTVFYHHLKNALDNDGISVIQSTSPFVAPGSFWCVDTTLHAAGFLTKPYHNMVPSFGEWGYIMAFAQPEHNWFANLPDSLKFLSASGLPALFQFPPDMKPKTPPEPNRLNNQVLVQYFEKEWEHYQDQ